LEVVAREQLAKVYEKSLNYGVEKLTVATENVAESPLLKEI
jgi:hypothetical protein